MNRYDSNGLDRLNPFFTLPANDNIRSSLRFLRWRSELCSMMLYIVTQSRKEVLDFQIHRYVIMDVYRIVALSLIRGVV